MCLSAFKYSQFNKLKGEFIEFDDNFLEIPPHQCHPINTNKIWKIGCRIADMPKEKNLTFG